MSYSEDKLIYPEVSVLPEKCRVCPGVSDCLDEWRLNQAITDRFLQLSVDPEVDTDQVSEILSPALRHTVVAYINGVMGLNLDPYSEEDRKKAFELATNIQGPAYQTARDIIEQQELTMSTKVEACEGKGPLKIRVRTDSASAVVWLCRADIEYSHPGHQHRPTVFLQREE